jgi:tetratricopeptide (TPR) repeat protein
MSSFPPKFEARRRPVSVLALKLWEMAEALHERLDNPGEVLEILVSSAAKGEQAVETWERLHEAAQRFDKMSDLALAYEHVTLDKRVKLLPPEQQAFIFLQATQFFTTLGDTEGAAGYAERAIAAVPGHPEAFARLEALLTASGKLSRLAQHYLDASQRETDVDRRRGLLERAFSIASSIDAAELIIEAGQRLLKLSPAADDVREEVMRRLIGAGRHKDVVELIEQALGREPPPPADEDKLYREQLVDLCFTVLKSPERALTHVEGLLRIDPSHEMALGAAESLLDNKPLMLRAAAALSDAFERTGNVERAVAMLTFELRHVRGPRRIDVQRRLGILRQDALNDPAGALELLAPVVAGDPGDDALRRRFVELSLNLNQPAETARLLARALQSHRDPAVRARVGVDVGDVYLKSGDVKRAQAAFQKVLETDSDERATLAAAHRLSDLYADSGDMKLLAGVLETIVRLETEKEARQAAARRLARICDAELPDSARAILAFRALVGSPWTDEALTRLEALYRDAADDVGLSDVLAFRAERSKDPEQARELAAQALELRTARTRDPESAIAAYYSFSNSFGASRDVNARLMPLLEQTGRFGELAEVVTREIALAPEAERAKLWLRLAQLRQTRLGNAQGAFEALERALALDPADRTLRAALEKLLSVPEVRLRAAALLSPLYADGEPSVGQLRVLEARAEGEPEVQDRLLAAEQAVALAQGPLRDPERALEIAARALADAVGRAPDVIERWLAEVQRLGANNPERRARLLFSALTGREIDSRQLFELAQAAGDAAQAAGDLPRAIEIYRHALAFDPSSRKLVKAIDELLAQQGVPSDRLALYEAALAEEQEPQRRRDLLHAMARLQRVELSDVLGATVTLRRAVAEEPRDLAAHDALLEALNEAGDFSGAALELERMLPLLEGDRRSLALLRLAEAAERAGDPAGSLARYRELIECADLSDDVLANVERLALEQGDGVTLRSVLEQRLLGTTDPRQRVQLLERLGNASSWQLGDAVSAANFWLEGARLSQGAAADPERARRLYDRVLDADPKNLEAAERLLELCAADKDWTRLSDAFAIVLEGSEERAIVATLLGLEEQAVLGGAGAEFVALVDRTLARKLDPQRARHLVLAKARALGTVSARADEAAAIFRGLIEGARDGAEAEIEAFSEFLKKTTATAARKDDQRWLFRLRAEKTTDPISVLLDWARAEEHELGDKKAARALYERITTQDAEQNEAWTELARLQALDGEPESALASLSALRERIDGEARTAVDLRIAGLMIEHLGRAEEALALVRPIIAASPSDMDALRIVHRALALPETRAQAAELLERAADAFEDPARRADVIEALLAVSAEAPDLSAARSRWLTQLLETKADQPEEALRISLRGAEAAPGELELWKVAEQMARRLDNPHPVVDAYTHAFERTLSPEIAEELGQRMVEFYGEWFDEPERVVGMLQRILELSPTAGWAFDRLKLAFSGAGRWQELFTLYDGRLAAPQAPPERVELLREAAMAARDFAGDPERAIGYLEALNHEGPGDQRVESSLERLYERHAKKRPLIALLSARLAGAVSSEKGDLVARIAALWLDLAEPTPALELAETLFAEKERRGDAVQLLERLITLPVAREPLARSLEEGEEAEQQDPEKTETPLRLAITHLKSHYRATKSTVDVVRMLEIEEGVARSREERRGLLEEIVSLRLGELGDALGAFETTAELVLLDSGAEKYRATLAQLAGHVQVHARQAEVLAAAARAASDPAIRGSLLNEAAAVHRGALAGPQRAIDLYREVLLLAGAPAAEQLEAARALSELLRAEGDPAERVAVLERLSDLVEVPLERRAALGEAATIAFETLADAPRAIAAYRKRLADDRTDLEAMNGLCVALTAIARWDELISALEARAAIEAEPEARRDRVRIAELHAETRGDRATAIEAWRRVVSLHGGDRESFDAQNRLLSAEQRWPELARLFEQEISAEGEPERERQLFLELGALHEQRTLDRVAALEAYVSAGDWPSAIRVAGAPPPDRATGRRVCTRLLELSTASWQKAKAGPECEAARAADWALSELSERLLEDGEYEAVVEGLLDGAKLPFVEARRRDLRREAACLVSDRLGDPDWAIELFQGLLAEDPADDVAVSSVTRLALLLEEKGRFEEIVQLWENQARARAGAGDVAAAQVLWARAGELSEERLQDVERALVAYDNGAALGGEVCLEALARIHGARGRIDLVADALERLCKESAADTLGERALSLAEAYVLLEKPLRARETLEQAVQRVIDGAPLRARLASLYREAEDFTALAKLTEDEAERATDRRARLALLREAALLHLDRRAQPAPAVPLLERAIELDPDDSSLRLLLARALYEKQRFEDAANVLREQLARYGGRRPKDRALVHFELARALLAANDRTTALVELDAASKIDPAHPSILEMLARTALDQGELERAERMYRALLLVAVKEGDPNPPSRSEALYALGDVAQRRGDSARAEEFTQSAFDAALENPREARSLEQTLKQRGRSADLVRVLELRLGQSLVANEAARVLSDLAEIHAAVPAELDRVRAPLLKRAAKIEAEIDGQEVMDDGAWAALGRVYTTLADAAGEGRVLERRIEASARSSRPPPDGDLLYRLAGARLSNSEDIDGALDLLERALGLAPDFERAEALLRGALGEDAPPRAALLLERIARERGDAGALVRALERRIAAGDADIAAVREGIELAERLQDPELVGRLLSAALLSGAFDTHADTAAWLRLELAKRYRGAGDVAAALELEEQACGYLTTTKAKPLLLFIAREALAAGEPARAARVLEVLRAEDPENRDIFGPLLALYRQRGPAEKLVELLEATAPLVTSAEERLSLRLEQVEVMLERLGRREDAIALLQEIVRDAPNERASRVRLAELLAADGREDELSELLVAELDEARDAGDVAGEIAIAVRLATLLERQGRAADALDVCKRALERDPTRRELLEQSVRLAKTTGDPDRLAEALESLLKVERGPSAAALCRRLVALREQLADSAGAERALVLGFAACPSDAELCDELARRYGDRGESGRVAELLERALVERPDDRKLLEQMVEAQRSAGRAEQALGALENFLRRHADEVGLYRVRASVLSELGRDEEAVRDLERASVEDPEALPKLIEVLERAITRSEPERRAALALRLIEILEHAGESDKARARLVELAADVPGDSAVLSQLAAFETRLGNLEGAIDAYTRLAEIAEGSELSHAALAVAELSQRTGQAEQARPLLERALEAEPSNVEVRTALFAVLQASGAHRELGELTLAQALDMPHSPERVATLRQAGELFLVGDEIPQAVHALELARSEAGDNLEVVVLLARAYTRAARLEEALAHLSAVLDANKGKRIRTLGAVYEEKANVHLEEGFLTDALGALTKAFEMDPKNSRLGMRLGRLALEAEEDDLAQRALRSVAIMKTAEEDGPEGARPETKADANYALAALAHRAGDPRKAKILAAKAISENPEHQEARALIAQLDRR